MILDAELQFSNSQAVTAAAASTNYIDLSAVRDIGTGEDLYIVVNCEVAMADSGSDSTLDVYLYGDSTTSFTPDGSQLLFTFSAASAAGTVKIAKLSPSAAPLQYRYIELYYSPNNGNLSAGTFSAHLTSNIDKYTAYADNIVIS